MDKIFGHYIPLFGKPSRIVTDHGTQFTSQVWKDKLRKEGIQHNLTSIRHPQAKMVERDNRELSKFFRILLGELRHSSWYDKLQTIEDILNETHHDTMEFTPMEIMLKKKPTRFWRKWLPDQRADQQPTYEQKLFWVRERIRKKGTRRAQKTDTDRKITSYQENEQVLVMAYNLSDKILKRTARFRSVFAGPYIINKILREGTYSVTHVKNNKERGVFHANDLRKYYANHSTL